VKPCCSNRPRRFGPGTVLSILAAGTVFVVANHRPERAAPPIDVQAARESMAKRPKPPPLLKPEPEILLRSDELRLSEAQRRQISARQAAWDETKSSLEAEMRASVGEDLRPNEQAIRDQMRNVPELSREFDRERRAAWKSALETLTKDQIARLSPELRGEL